MENTSATFYIILPYTASLLAVLFSLSEDKREGIGHL